MTASGPRRPHGSRSRPSAVLVFVGERRSERAMAMGVRWEDGRLAARTLHEALAALGIEPSAQVYLNLFQDPPGPLTLDHHALGRVRALAAQGLVVVGMGRSVQKALAARGVPHLPLIHPAARGHIRARAAYLRHVAQTLGCALPPGPAGSSRPLPDLIDRTWRNTA